MKTVPYFVIRPIQESDLNGLMELLADSGHGLTTLPKDPTLLKKRIQKSERSFIHRDEKPTGEDYLFVMEEKFRGKIVGVCAIISKIGGFEPSYFYKMEVHHHESKMIHVKNKITTLHFHYIHNGPAEICSLYLSPEYRNSQNGRFLSLSRFLYIAANRKFFEQKIIAEMRGMVNDSGHSPFWDAVGDKFFKIDFPTADYLYVKNKKFVEELMPKEPIIANLLPEDAQKVLAKVHPNTEPARRILEQEGFKFSGLVGLFEPGPVLEASIDDIRTIRESERNQVAEITPKNFRSETFIIATLADHYKAVLGGVVRLKEGGVRVSQVTATALNLKLGDEILYASFKEKKNKERLPSKKSSKNKFSSKESMKEGSDS